MKAPIIAAALAAVSVAHAATIAAVTPLAGYSCASLNATEPEIMSRGFAVPILAEPRADAAPVGLASATLIERNPPNIVGGYAEVLRLDGRGPGWVLATRIVPYASRHSPNAICRPFIMSDGKPGFGGL